jgi:hypothetical protein
MFFLVAIGILLSGSAYAEQTCQPTIEDCNNNLSSQNNQIETSNMDGKSNSFARALRNALLDKQKSMQPTSPPLTDQEILKVRMQIEKCWNVPPSAKDLNISVEVKAEMNVDGTVKNAKIANEYYYLVSDAANVMAESVLRAVLNPMCWPFPLPKEKYDRWNFLILNFDLE